MDWRLDSIAVRITLAIILGVLLFLGASVLILVYMNDTSEGDVSQMLTARLADSVRIVDAATLEERPRLIDSLSSPSLIIRMRDTPLPALMEEHGPQAAILRLRLRLQSALEVPRPPLVIGRSLETGKLVVEVGLSDGGWLLFSSPNDVLGFVPIERFAWRLGAFCLFMGAASVWASRRLAKSISDFAAAAERLGVDTAAPPLAERGPRELRVAIRAFNRMQGRLHRFVDDRTQMLAAMSHDLRTPLTRLRIRVEFVEDDGEREKMLSDLDAMSAMITSTLAFARDDTQREPRMLVDLSVLVGDICEDAADVGADVVFSGPAKVDLPCRPIAVRRAVVNLVDNAVKYGRNARVKLACGVDCVTVIVEDSGPGIPEAEHEKVFAPFYRLDPSRSRDTGGAGLGLAVTRTIAREHGGDVVLSNRAEGGLRASLSLPV
jgi:signal transduction histidine kinase